VRVWLVQMNAEPEDKYGNLHKIHKYIDKASSSRIDLVAFPELAISGYVSGSKLYELAEPIPGPSTEHMIKKAENGKMYIVMGMPEIRDGSIYNSAPVFGPEGLIGIYRKHYLPEFASLDGFKYEEGRDFEPALDLRVFDTRFGKIGIEICYDAWHPEIARAQALQDAWLIVNISAAPIGAAGWFQLLARARALENIVWFAFVNQVGLQEGIPFGGGTCMVSHLSNIEQQASIGKDGKEEIVEYKIDNSAIFEKRLNLPFLKDVRPEVLKKVYEIARSIRG